MAAPLTISAADLASLAAGSSKCMKASGKNVIVHKAADGTLRATLNHCVHMNGSFVPDVEDATKMKCTMHGMMLDPATMTYLDSHPAKLLGMTLKKVEPGMKQPEFVVALAADGSATLTPPEGAAPSGGCALA